MGLLPSSAASVRSFSAAEVRRPAPAEGDECHERQSQSGSTGLPKGKGKGQNKNNAASFLCKYDNRWHPLEERVPGFQCCRPTKRAYDSLARLAEKQKEHAWWSEVKSNEKRLRSVIAAYMKQSPDGVGRGKKKSSFKIAEYRETIEASTSVQKRVAGKMMWKEEWIVFAGSVQGGYKQRPVAEGEWDQWVRDGSRQMDEEGPAEAPLRIWAKTADEIDGLTEVSLKKSLNVSQGQQKKFDAADLMNMRHRVLVDHETVAGFEAADLTGVAAGMVSTSSSGSSPWQGGLTSDALFPVNLRKTIISAEASRGASSKASDAVEAQEDEAPSGEAGSGEAGGGVEEPTKRKAKAEKYFDLARGIAANSSAWLLAISQLINDGKSVQSRTQAEVDIFAGISSEEAVYYESSMKLITSRKTVLDKVLAEPTADMDIEVLTGELDQYLQSLQARVSSGGKIQPQGAPPIQKFLDLKVACALEQEGKQMYADCSGKAELTIVGKQLAAHKDAIKDLIANCKVVLKDLASAKASRAKMKKEKGKGLQNPMSEVPSKPARVSLRGSYDGAQAFQQTSVASLLCQSFMLAVLGSEFGCQGGTPWLTSAPPSRP